jgi:SAM-dependent methyltransferase
MKYFTALIGFIGVKLRNAISRKMFLFVKQYCAGLVLDVGGGSFYRYLSPLDLPIRRWVSLDPDASCLRERVDDKHEILVGDGCGMAFADASFDAVLNSQVLEHVMDPLTMVAEISRVLKPGGYAIFLVPQTACIHLVPHCYSNFTIYWIRNALARHNLAIVEEEALGGFWRTILFRFLYFFLEALRFPAFTDPAIKRNRWFYALFPLMALYALASIPILLLLQLGDLKEEPNNHLVVARKSPLPPA